MVAFYINSRWDFMEKFSVYSYS